jgi:hypothetical protein
MTGPRPRAGGQGRPPSSPSSWTASRRPSTRTILVSVAAPQREPRLDIVASPSTSAATWSPTRSAPTSWHPTAIGDLINGMMLPWATRTAVVADHAGHKARSTCHPAGSARPDRLRRPHRGEAGRRPDQVGSFPRPQPRPLGQRLRKPPRSSATPDRRSSASTSSAAAGGLIEAASHRDGRRGPGPQLTVHPADISEAVAAAAAAISG